MSTSQIPDGTRVSMSGRELVFGETIFTPRDATDLSEDTEALHQRIEEDGYLLCAISTARMPSTMLGKRFSPTWPLRICLPRACLWTMPSSDRRTGPRAFPIA